MLFARLCRAVFVQNTVRYFFTGRPTRGTCRFPDYTRKSESPSLWATSAHVIHRPQINRLACGRHWVTFLFPLLTLWIALAALLTRLGTQFSIAQNDIAHP